VEFNAEEAIKLEQVPPEIVVEQATIAITDEQNLENQN
jgi:hypothetical protein